MNIIKRLIIPFVVFLIIVMSSCSNKVDINDKYKDISIVYGLLDPSADQHFVKITKAFQTEGNVYLASGKSENSQYSPDDLEVWIEEYAYGIYKRSISLDTVLIKNKESGVFYFPSQIVYATQKGVVLSSEYEYKLKIKIKSSGKIIEAKTKLVRDFAIRKPPSQALQLDFSGNYNLYVKWNSAKNGKLYQLTIRYFYTELTPGGKSTSHYVDWVQPSKKSETTDGAEEMEIEYSGKAFYDILAANIPEAKAGIKRYSDSIYYMFTVADENFSVYLDVNAPSNSIVQERPAYSNISNGLGLFASRYNKIRFFDGLNQKSLDTLISGRKTNKLGFEFRP